MNHQSGFIAQGPVLLYGALAAGAVILSLSIALYVQTVRLNAEQKDHRALVLITETLGKQAEADKEKKEKEHAKVVSDVSKAWQGSLTAAVDGAVGRYAKRVRGNNSGSSPVPRVAGDTQAPNAALADPVACAPDEAFIKECAAGAVMIDSFQVWATGIGFPLK